MEESPRPRRFDRLNIGVAMLLVAGAGVGLWLAIHDLQDRANDVDLEARFNYWLFGFVFVLGGLALVGPPLLLMTARRRPWDAGRFLWFVQGTAAWLLWPPIVYRTAGGFPGSMSGTCFFFGTPLMALYVTLTLLASGHLRRSRRRRLRRSWQESFGLLLGLVWACTGLYVLSLFYREDFLRK
jgi:hypothetical protein